MAHDETLLLYMLEYAGYVVESAKGVTWEEFLADREKRDSVVLQISNIGEAANHVSDAFQKRHPEIPWSNIIGMRHRMIHGYKLVNYEMVWKAAQQAIPELIRLLEPLVPPEKP
ncbi:MAG TPA: HepT-like ribonuclease domain-containing protein [bacterium]|jgi:uncharacterized protein with HEPN domain